MDSGHDGIGTETIVLPRVLRDESTGMLNAAPLPFVTLEGEQHPESIYPLEATPAQQAQAQDRVYADVAEHVIPDAPTVSPALVHIVHHVTRVVPEGSATFAAYSVQVGTSPTQVLPKDPTRREATILNNAGSTLYIGHRDNLETVFGFPLAVGASLTIKSIDAVWGVVASGAATADVRLWSERNDMAPSTAPDVAINQPARKSWVKWNQK